MAGCASFKLVALVVLIGAIVLHCEAGAKGSGSGRGLGSQSGGGIGSPPGSIGSLIKKPIKKPPGTKPPKPNPSPLPTRAPTTTRRTTTKRSPTTPRRTTTTRRPTTTRSPTTPRRTTTTRAPTTARGPTRGTTRGTTTSTEIYIPELPIETTTQETFEETTLLPEAEILPPKPKAEPYYIYTVYPLDTETPVKSVMEVVRRYKVKCHRLNQRNQTGIIIAIPVKDTLAFETISTAYSWKILPMVAENSDAHQLRD